MATQICNKCKEEKDEEAFCWDRKGINRRYKVCKQCKCVARKEREKSNPDTLKKAQEYRAQYYEEHKEKYKDYWATQADKRKAIQHKYLKTHYKKIQLGHRTRKQQIKEQYIEFFGGVCEVCKQPHEWYQYDFHHINPEEKEYNVCSMFSMTEDKIKKEMSKCILVCANCHRKVHYELDEQNEPPRRGSKSAYAGQIHRRRGGAL